MTRYAQESRHLYLSGGGIVELAARTSSMAQAGGALCCRRDCGQIVAKPAPQQVPDAGVGFAEHEMIGIADEVQLGGLPGALEQLDRLLGRGDRIVGGMKEEKRPRRDAAHNIIGAEIEPALGGLCRTRFDRVSGKIAAQVRRYLHALAAPHPQRLPRSRAAPA